MSDPSTDDIANVYEGPLPAVTNLNRPYWDGLRDHRLLTQRCGACNRPWLPPGPWCPLCWSLDHVWEPLSGRGTISSWVRFHQQYYRRGPFEVPYEVVEVTLAEGPRLYAQLLQGEPLTGAAVEIVYHDVSPELTLARFRLA